jgi:hypothetical protein
MIQFDVKKTLQESYIPNMTQESYITIISKTLGGAQLTIYFYLLV